MNKGRSALGELENASTSCHRFLSAGPRFESSVGSRYVGKAHGGASTQVLGIFEWRRDSCKIYL